MIHVLGASTVLSATISIPWSGSWVADLVLDDAPPSGKVPLILGDNPPMLGTIDPQHTGTFGQNHRARLVGGMGWRKEVPPQHFHSPGVLLSSAVIMATGAAVGEIATVVVPEPLGEDYVRVGGPASRVLDRYEWHVTSAGVTMVGPRIPKPLDPTAVELLSYDPTTRVAVLGGTTVVEPGAIILPDPLRGLEETLIVRHVEIELGPAGFTVRATCSPDAPTEIGHPVVSLLRRLIKETTKAEFQRMARYRVVSPGPEDGTYLLQAVAIGDDADLIPARVWPGMAGLSSKLLPSSIVLVAFGKDETEPMIVGFDDSTPLELTLDASLMVKVGAGTFPVLRATPAFLAWVTAITGAVNGLAPGSATAPTDMASLKFFSE